MEFKTDIEIAQSCEMKNIREIAETAGVEERYLELYGNYKAKVDYKLLNEDPAPDGKGRDRLRRNTANRSLRCWHGCPHPQSVSRSASWSQLTA